MFNFIVLAPKNDQNLISHHNISMQSSSEVVRTYEMINTDSNVALMCMYRRNLRTKGGQVRRAKLHYEKVGRIIDEQFINRTSPIENNVLKLAVSRTLKN